MKTKQDLHINILGAMKFLFFALLFVLSGCGGQDEPAIEKEDGVQLSDKEITIDADGWKPLTESRATIFENENDFLNDDPEAKGGGNFTMHAYLKETGATFIGGARAWYFNNEWRFYDERNNRFPAYYWPQNNSVDFFAYMPWSGSQRRKYITVGNYTQGTGLTINCTMQEITTLEDVDGQETIIAYTANKSKADKNVNMHFVHPFASVSFELKRAHRNLTINWIEFNNIYLQGYTTLNASTTQDTQINWTPSGDVKSFHIVVDKTIPEDINFGREIGEKYLVMPQTFEHKKENSSDDITVTINYTWDDDGNHYIEPEDTKNFTSSIIVTDEQGNPLVTEWEAGYNYKYILSLGDNDEEIHFKVEVEPWISTGKNSTGGNNNIFDIE